MDILRFLRKWSGNILALYLVTRYRRGHGSPKQFLVTFYCVLTWKKKWNVDTQCHFQDALNLTDSMMIVINLDEHDTSKYA